VDNEMLLHQRSGAGAQVLAERAASLGRSADHQVVIGVDDRDLDVRRGVQFGADAGDWGAHPPVGPVGRHVRPPGFAGRLEGAAEVALVHRGGFDIVDEAAHVLPETEGEQRIAFAERQADGGVRGEFEHIAQEDCVGLRDQRHGAELFKFRKGGLGEQGCHRLRSRDRGECLGDFRESHQQAASHARIRGC
jgi:hypothetical protein